MIRPLAFGCLSAVLLTAGGASTAAAEVTPAPIFGDHMMFPADEPAPVFGTTEPGGGVSVHYWTVTPGAGDAAPVFSAANTATATADDAGRWQTKIGPFKSGTELFLIVKDDRTELEPPDLAAERANPRPDSEQVKTFTDVLVGDVWLCSGQSNMEWALADTVDAEYEIPSATNDEIRLFSVPRQSVRTPQTQLGGGPGGNGPDPSFAQWVKLRPDNTAGWFSAVGYYFAKTLHARTGRPIGMVDASWSGTPSEAWTREESLKPLKTAAPLLDRWAGYDAAAAAGEDAGGNWAGPYGPTHSHHPGNLNYGMIAPLVPFAFKGAIWYQGESNADRAEQYDEIFPAMIEDWRAQFGRKLPFFWVQLPNYRAYREDPNAGSDWAELRGAQDGALDKLKSVGQAVMIDGTEADNLHPRDKRPVGERLASAALEMVYDLDEPGLRSPRKTSVTMDGATATVTFDTAGDALQARRDRLPADAQAAAGPAGPGAVLGFAVAGADRRFYRATAEITGPGTVKVNAPAQVPEIVAVRYGWADNPRVTLFNTRGLPAAPFRTDDWPGVTAGKYVY